MKFYKDESLTQEILFDKFDFGIIPAGESKRFKFYVLNNENAYLQQLLFTVEHQEVKVIEAPIELNPQEVGELILEWNATVTLKEGLHARIRVRGFDLRK